MGRVTREEQAALYAKACKTTCANIPQPLAHRYALDLEEALERVEELERALVKVMPWRARASMRGEVSRWYPALPRWSARRESMLMKMRL